MEKHAEESRDASAPRLVLASLAVGVAAAALAVAFRGALDLSADARQRFLTWASGAGAMGLAALVVACGALGALSVWLVRRFAPEAAGSGIPHVEQALAGEREMVAARVLPVKFLAGLAGIGGGMALGREGPTVQMGAAIAQVVGRLIGTRHVAENTLLAIGAGAGLATAFNAPLSGAVFIVEELRQRVSPVVVLAYLLGAASADVVARVAFGQEPVFTVALAPPAALESLPLAAVAGLAAGLLGIVYNRSLLATMRMFDRLRRWPNGSTGFIAGAMVGAVAWWWPTIIGDGHSVTNRLFQVEHAAGLLAVMLVVRLGLSLVSYGCGAAGGIFAPLLCLGAIAGNLVAEAGASFAVGADVTAMCVAAAMAAMFAASVRAPVTGIALVIEMTGDLGFLLPVLLATCVAVAVAESLRDPPIYESLKKQAGGDRPEAREAINH